MEKSVKVFGVFFVITLLLLVSFSFSEEEAGRVVADSSDDKVVADKSSTNTVTPSSDAVTDNGDSRDINNDETSDAESDGNSEDLKKIEGLVDKYENVEITSNRGPLAFIGDIFKDDIEKKIDKKEIELSKTIREIEDGDIDAAREHLENYKDYVEDIEKIIDPSREKEIKRSAAGSYVALKEIEEKIPEEYKEEFFNEVVLNEAGIVTATEIANKIRDLCEQLAGLDPVKYAETCKSDDDDAKWKKKLDKKLTKEQEKEAKEFGKIMKECFSTNGKECRCEDISFNDFSVFCEKMSSFSVKCDEGDESACDAMEEEGQNMPELPPHLQNIFNKIESGMASRYEGYQPEECKGLSPKECMLEMTKKYAPPECKDALEKGIESGEIKGEMDAKKLCEKIMMPEECSGLSPEECAKRMMPPECVEKDLDPKECKKYMDSMDRGYEKGPSFVAPGRDCMKFEDANERLKCFEESVNNIGNYYGIGKDREGEITWQCKENRIHDPLDCKRFMEEEWPKMERERQDMRNQNKESYEEIRKKEEECANKCFSENKAWDFTGGVCNCREGDYRREEYNQRAGPRCDDCASQCLTKTGQRLRGTGCGPNGCECYYEDDDSNREERREERPPETTTQPPESSEGSNIPPSNAPPSEIPPSTSSSSSSSSSSRGSVTEPSGSSSSGGSSGGGDAAGITGGVVNVNKVNRFLDYFLR